MTQVNASVLRTLLEVLYSLIIDYQLNEEGPASKETKAQLQSVANTQWKSVLPSLQKCVKSSIAGSPDKIQNLVLLGFEIKDKFNELRLNKNYTSDELDAVKAAGMYLRTDSEGAYSKMMKLANLAGSFASQHMRPSIVDQGSVKQRLQQVVKNLVGRSGFALTTEESVAAKSAYPQQYKEYLSLRRLFNQSWQSMMTDFVRSSGQSKVPYRDLIDYLDQQNVDYSLVRGFTGLIDDRGRLYTNSGELISGVPAAINFPTVVMNKDYPKTQWVFQSRRPDGGPGQLFYTDKFRRSQSEKKFSNVEKLSDKMPSIRRKWYSSVKNFNQNDIRCVASLILELLYLFSARIGTPGNTTFGIGTLQVRHIVPQSSGNLLIRYKGKDGVLHKHILLASDPEMKYSVEALNVLCEGKEQKDKVFTVGTKPVGPAVANSLFKQLSGMPDITVHKIRTFRGTTLFRNLMEDVMPKLERRRSLTEREALDIFKKMAEKVGKLLNHVRRGAGGTRVTGLTAINSYIDKNVSRTYFEQLGFRPPRVLDTATD